MDVDCYFLITLKCLFFPGPTKMRGLILAGNLRVDTVKCSLIDGLFWDGMRILERLLSL
jgi:hypothetical protein